ncbi:P-type ATPase [Planoprotostelium fungivorum]|uniref:Calcium-transporting ATPase n=1 Tax=Planoprotostelium fungivorum TaxID=1890364 RepID=A0A2P6NUU3_9EUKA|nr:P-type ATPase [Planoprotostelium fungivorum]
MKFEGINGLTEAQVAESKRNHGSNDLPPPEEETFWDKLKDNFSDPLIRILLVALGITMFLALVGYADWVEGVGIAVAVFLATFVSTYSEYKNESSFRKLQEEASRAENSVFRDGQLKKILASDIVVGDEVLLQAGDKLPADGQLIHGEFQANQVSLTGEREALSKRVSPKGYSPPEASNFFDEYLCFRGSVVDDGEAILKVCSVGSKTFYGQLYDELTKNEDDRESPLQTKLSDLADGVATFGYIGASLIAVSFLFKQIILDNNYEIARIKDYLSVANWQVAVHDLVTSVILAIIVIVVAVPEGLPMMIAIVLSLNMRKLLKAKVLVRKLLGIETAGSLNILFVDKTGTLTKGIFIPSVFMGGNTSIYQSFLEIPAVLRSILAFSLIESTSSFIGENGPVGGNASDRALLQFLDNSYLKEDAQVSIKNEILFNSERKFSSVQLSLKDQPAYLRTVTKNNTITIVKGAPDYILNHCHAYLGPDGRQEKNINLESINNQLNEVSKSGIRVIAIALTDEEIDTEKNTIPNNLVLLGVMGIEDEIRKESAPAIDLAQRAGIQVVMITGDKKETATAVAHTLGLLKDGKSVLTSQQLASISDERLQEIIPTVGVIARALPTDKSRLVRVCQKAGKVVGMTGDGVNDSAALSQADVGFAMGSGAEVAKEASDIVIMDDNFESITKAVLFGRTVFRSIRKFIVFQSTVNCASLLIVFLGPFFGFDFPLTLIQLLWVNLVMDTLAAMAFGGEPALMRYMSEEKPIKRDQPIISLQMWSAIIINGMFIAILCVIFLTYDPIRDLFIRNGQPDEPAFLTAFFAFFIFLTNFNSFNARTPKLNIFDHIFENSGFVWVVLLIFVVQITFTYLGGNILRTVGLTFHEWIMIIGASSVIVPFDILRKILLGPYINHYN